MTASGSAELDGALGVTAPWSSHHSSEAKLIHHAAPQTLVIQSYFDSTLPRFSWYAPVNYGSFALITLGQRITLPADRGVLESVTIQLDTVWGDTVGVLIVPDTLYSTDLGNLHLMNIFGPDPYYSEAVAVKDIPADGKLVINPQVMVPHDFFVVVDPKMSPDGSSFTSGFAIRGDREPSRVRTTENTRSAFIALLSNGAPVSAVLDSTIMALDTHEMLFTNLDVTTETDAQLIGVSEQKDAELSLYPNPATAQVNFRLPASFEGGTVSVIDMLGRTIKSEPAGASLSTIDLPNGAYRVVLKAGGRTLSSNIVVHH